MIKLMVYVFALVNGLQVPQPIVEFRWPDLFENIEACTNFQNTKQNKEAEERLKLFVTSFDVSPDWGGNDEFVIISKCINASIPDKVAPRIQDGQVFGNDCDVYKNPKEC